MATSSEIQVTEAYIGLLGRAPDPEGLAYWAAELDAAIADGTDPAVALKELTNNITLSEEWDGGIGAYDATTLGGAESVVTDMYDNLFDRVATQAELDYWAPKIVSGEFTASEMAVALIQGAGTTDADVLSYKQQAATYYVETVPQENFNRESAANAVVDVNGPITLQESKDLTDVVATGVGESTDLADVAAGEAVTMTATNDTVVGTVGTDATYSTQTIDDTTTADYDILQLTGDAGFTFASVTDVEQISVSLADTVGAGFTIDATAVTTSGSSTMFLDVAETVEVVGVELQGETTATVSGLAVDLATTNVTDLTADTGDADVLIAGDADLATIAVSAIADDTTTITTENATASVTLGGTAAGNDAASVYAPGAVALDANDTTELVEELTLGGLGAAVEFTITNATGADMTYTTAGDQDVTLSGAATQFDDSSFSDGSTGTTSVDISTGGDANLAEWGVVSGGIELSDDFGGNTVSVASGNTISITATQTSALNIDSNDTAAAAVTISLGAAADDLVIGDFAAATINTGNDDATMVDLSANAAGTSDNDVDVTIAGTAALSITGVAETADLTIGGNTDITFGSTIDTDGVLDVTGSGAVAVSGAIDVENDASITGDSVTLGSTVAVSAAGAMTITSTANDVTLSGAATNAEGDITVTSAGAATVSALTATSGNIDITATGAASTSGAVDASNDVSISGDSVTLGGTVDVSTAGALTITSTANDVTASGAITNAEGDVTITSAGDATLSAAVTATVGNIDVTATGAASTSAAVDASNDVSISGDSVTLGSTVDVSTAGALTITSTANDVTASGAVTNALGDVTITSAGAATLSAAVTATEGNIEVTATGDAAASAAITASNDVSVTGDDVTVDDLVSGNTGDITVTATNDVLTTGSITNTAGDGSLVVSAGGAISLTAGETIAATNDITITSTGSGVFTQNDVTIDATAGDIMLTAGTMTGTGTITATAGDITLNMTNDAAAQSSLGVVDATAGAVSIVDGDFAITEVGSNDATGGLTISGTADATITTASLVNSGLYLTTANDVTITTLDTAIVAGSGTGNYDLGTVASSAVETIQITTGSGDDTMDLDAGGGNDIYLVQTGDGDDTVTATETNTGSVVNMGDGDDTFAPVAGGFTGTAVLGDGSDTLSLDNGGDYSGDGLVTGIEIISLEGTAAAEISLDQFAGDDTFEVQGADGTIIIDGSAETTDTSIDLTNVTHQAGNQTGFTLTGGSGNDTIVGASRDDTISGGDGADTLTGGNGADAFTYAATSEGGDTIVDFDSGADTLGLAATVFQVGMAGTITTAASDAALQAAVFSGTDLSVFLSGNSGTFSAQAGSYGLIFIDTSGTDAGVYYVTGTVVGAATVAAAATGVTSNVVTIALTGDNAVAAGDFYIF